MINNSLLLRTAGSILRSKCVKDRLGSGISRMYRDPAWMLAAFLVGGKQELCPRNSHGRGVGSSTAGKSSRAPPVHHEGDPRVLLRIEAQCVWRPTPTAKRHRHVGGHRAFGHAEAGAAAPVGRIYEHAPTTRHQTHHCERSRAIAGSK